MWWIVSVWAVEEPCEPTRMRDVANKVAAAERFLAADGLLEARPLLDEVSEDVLCLQVPMDPKVLSTYAWLQAERAAREHDLLAVMPWVWLAQESNDQKPPAHHTGLEVLAVALGTGVETPPRLGPIGFVRPLARGAVVVNGVARGSLQNRVGTPYLLQVFEERELRASSWGWGADFPGDWLVAADPGQQPDWRPRRSDSVESWSAWVAANPDAAWLPGAKARLDDLRAERAMAEGGPGQEAYLADEPLQNRVRVEGELERSQFARAQMDASVLAWERFLQAHPRGLYAGEARMGLDAMEWERTEAADTLTAYQRYLERFPWGRHAGAATERASARAAQRGEGSVHPLTLAAAEQAVKGWNTIVVSGDTNEAVVLALRRAHLPVTRAFGGPPPAVNPAETGLLYSRAAELGDGSWAARAELWAPGGRRPVFQWDVRGSDLDAVREALAAELPEVTP